MIIKEELTINNKNFTRTYSDNDCYIKQISSGNLYSEAYDLIDYPQEYEETDTKIEHIEP